MVPYASFNLAHHVGEPPEVTRANWQVLAKAGGPTRGDVATCLQVHGDDIFEPRAGGDAPEVSADALISLDPAVGVGVYTADCVPVLYAVADRGGLAAAHCGWRGAAAGLAGKTLLSLAHRAGVDPGAVSIWLGPSIAQCSYEVGPELCERFDGQFLRKRNGSKWELDVAGAVVADLERSGAGGHMITRSAVDTYADADCYSYRRDGATTGRMLSFARWL